VTYLRTANWFSLLETLGMCFPQRVTTLRFPFLPLAAF
jgi:hypothetical protein